MPTPSPGTVGAILQDTGSVFTEGVSMVGQVATAVTGSPILLIFAVICLVGIGIGLFRRLMNVN